MALLGPFSVGYPVIFRSGGDTTRNAFGKHIQEIERIYGILNALDAGKISADDLQGKLDGFKPTVSFNDITGYLDMSRITGNLDFSRITGNVPAARVVGTLSNANIDAANVNGLESVIGGKIVDKGDGIIKCEPDYNGYAKFNNGLFIQWGNVNVENLGSSDVNEATERTASFPVDFPNICLNLQATIRNDANSGSPRARDHSPVIRSLATDKFVYQIQVPEDEAWDNLSLYFFAIGY